MGQLPANTHVGYQLLTWVYLRCGPEIALQERKGRGENGRKGNFLPRLFPRFLTLQFSPALRSIFGDSFRELWRPRETGLSFPAAGKKPGYKKETKVSLFLPLRLLSLLISRGQKRKKPRNKPLECVTKKGTLHIP